MNDFSYTTTYGSESLHEILLQSQIEDLEKQLTHLKRLCIDAPMLDVAVEQMVPGVRAYMMEEPLWEFDLDIGILKTCITGFGCTVTFKELFGIEEFKDDLMPWAVGLALMEKLQKRLPELKNMTIQPAYVMNALNLVLKNGYLFVSFETNSH